MQLTHFLAFLIANLSSLTILAVLAELPLEFPDGTTPVACRVSVYDSSSDSKVGVGTLMNKASVPSLPAGSLYMEEVHAKVACLCLYVLLTFCSVVQIFNLKMFHNTV